MVCESIKSYLERNIICIHSDSLLNFANSATQCNNIDHSSTRIYIESQEGQGFSFP